MTFVPPRPEAAPRQVAGYSLLYETFRTDVGAVWAAKKDDEESPSALLRRIARRGPPPAAVDRVVKAARGAQRIEVRGVLTIFDVVEGDADVAILSGHLAGDTLRNVLREAARRRQPMPKRVVSAMGLTLLDAVGGTHARMTELAAASGCPVSGVNPDQVVVGRSGEVRLFEIGMAGVLAQVEAWAKHPNRAAYRSPESFRSPDELGEPSDVFTMGVVLWEMFSNRRLFSGTTQDAIGKKVTESSIPRLDSLPSSSVSEPSGAAIADVVAKACERDIDKRYPDCAAMAAALREASGEVAGVDEAAAYVEALIGESLSRRARAPQPAAARPRPPPAPARRTVSSATTPAVTSGRVPEEATAIDFKAPWAGEADSAPKSEPIADEQTSETAVPPADTLSDSGDEPTQVDMTVERAKPAASSPAQVALSAEDEQTVVESPPVPAVAPAAATDASASDASSSDAKGGPDSTGPDSEVALSASDVEILVPGGAGGPEGALPTSAATADEEPASGPLSEPTLVDDLPPSAARAVAEGDAAPAAPEPLPPAAARGPAAIAGRGEGEAAPTGLTPRMRRILVAVAAGAVAGLILVFGVFGGSETQPPTPTPAPTPTRTAVPVDTTPPVPAEPVAPPPSEPPTEELDAGAEVDESDAGSDSDAEDAGAGGAGVDSATGGSGTGGSGASVAVAPPPRPLPPPGSWRPPPRPAPRPPPAPKPPPPKFTPSGI